MSDNHDDAAAGMIGAVCDTLEQGIAEAAAKENQRAGRHQLSVAAELTAEMRRITAAQGLEKATKERIDRVISAGLDASAKVPRICEECEDLYRHEPPATTKETCAFCTGERQNSTQEG